MEEYIVEEKPESQPKKRGRPKKNPDAPKAVYNLSRKEIARRAAQKQLNAAKRRAAKTIKAAEDKQRYAKKLEEKIGKVEAGLQGTSSRVIDQSDLDGLRSGVQDLVDEYEVVFKPNEGPQEEFLSSSERDVLYGGAAGGGMTEKGVREYKSKNPGSKLQTAVTTKPSKLKPGSKAAKRRKSFCARSKSWTSERGRAARRRWNC